MLLFITPSNKQQGIALIQVLLITAILSVLALYLSSTAKDQVAITQWSNDKTQALVDLHSAEAELIFTLLTTSRVNQTSKDLIAETNDVSQRWSFFSKPFTINDNVVIKIQDQAALIHAHFPNREHLIKLIVSSGETMENANAIVDNLLDWQDLDSIPRINGGEQLNNNKIRNGTIPDIHEVVHIGQVKLSLFNLFKKNLTIFRQGIFNPMNASEELLSALTNPTIAAQVIKLRNNGELTSTLFSRLTEITESDNTIFYPSNFLELEFNSKVGDTIVKKKSVIQLNPYASGKQLPINILSNKS